MVGYKALTATDFMEGRYLGTIEVDAALALVRVTAQRASETEAVGSDVCRPRSPRTTRGRWSQALYRRPPPPYNGAKRAAAPQRIVLPRGLLGGALLGVLGAGDFARGDFLVAGDLERLLERRHPPVRAHIRSRLKARACASGQGVKSTLAGTTRVGLRDHAWAAGPRAWACGTRRRQLAREDGNRAGAGMGTARTI